MRQGDGQHRSGGDQGLVLERAGEGPVRGPGGGGGPGGGRRSGRRRGGLSRGGGGKPRPRVPAGVAHGMAYGVGASHGGVFGRKEGGLQMACVGDQQRDAHGLPGHRCVGLSGPDPGRRGEVGRRDLAPAHGVLGHRQLGRHRRRCILDRDLAHRVGLGRGVRGRVLLPAARQGQQEKNPEPSQGKRKQSWHVKHPVAAKGAPSRGAFGHRYGWKSTQLVREAQKRSP
ncbi:MAG: hypothetical protein CVU65_04035 [Deltaproteobacteria bacterium HGW-Deltaproteobacteria-22]|nr:MAG: hypothetical protein CVU65_04035 [Deltaproteobacteria bacterium HGW-Deltaproteobacteria-22]